MTDEQKEIQKRNIENMRRFISYLIFCCHEKTAKILSDTIIKIEKEKDETNNL